MGIKISQVTQFGVYDHLRNLPKVKNRGHPELNQGPLDLQSNALPLSYIPVGLRTQNVEYKLF